MPRLLRASGAAAVVLGVVPALGGPLAAPVEASPTAPTPPDAPAVWVRGSGPTTATVVPSTAEPTAQTPHCGVRLMSPEQIRAGVRSDLRCFATRREARAAFGVDLDQPSLDDAATRSQALTTGMTTRRLSDGLVASHYLNTQGIDSPNGSELEVYGTSCGWGGWNLPSPFNDLIRSTRHRGCSSIKHYQGPEATGGQPQITNATQDMQLYGVNYGVSSVYYGGNPL